ncbi:MAG TPA: hypothetical protein VF469_29060 [Kofleriaceae bacterium]
MAQRSPRNATLPDQRAPGRRVVVARTAVAGALCERERRLLYQTEDGRTRVEVHFDGETAWLSLGQMAELFQRDKSVISRHIKNVFDELELNPEATVAKSATVQREGMREVTGEVAAHDLRRVNHARQSDSKSLSCCRICNNWARLQAP